MYRWSFHRSPYMHCCVTRECPSCPDLQVNVDKKLLPTKIIVCQLQTKKQKIKNKQGKWVEKSSLPILCKHIYMANYQWHAHSILQNNLDESSVITVEDYQMSIKVEFTENPTSLAYSTNKLLYALYPICVEYLEDGIMKKVLCHSYLMIRNMIMNKLRNLNRNYF